MRIVKQKRSWINNNVGKRTLPAQTAISTRSTMPSCQPTNSLEKMKWLKVKMERNPDFASKYSGVVEKYQTEGSSRQVPNEEVAGLKPL